MRPGPASSIPLLTLLSVPPGTGHQFSARRVRASVRSVEVRASLLTLERERTGKPRAVSLVDVSTERGPRGDIQAPSARARTIMQEDQSDRVTPRGLRARNRSVLRLFSLGDLPLLLSPVRPLPMEPAPKGKRDDETFQR